jgi:hypothetical protein
MKMIGDSAMLRGRTARLSLPAFGAFAGAMMLLAACDEAARAPKKEAVRPVRDIKVSDTSSIRE